MARFCFNCGNRVREGKSFCAACGARVDQQISYSSPETPRPRQYRQDAPQPQVDWGGRQYPYERAEAPSQPPRKKRRGGRVAVALVVVLAILLGGAAFAYSYLKKALGTAPDMRAERRGSGRVSVSELGNTPGRGEGRDTSKYTFLLLGADQGEYNTDVIMAATFDAAAHTLDVVNIPRDTLVNVSWPTKKANSILANMRARNSGEEDSEAKALQATVEMFADILGYEADYCALVNIRAFVELVDAVGGVDFYVPVNMNYDDPYGGLSIHYTEGMHHLTGQQAIEVVRFRSGYSNADIGRIGTQQDFLKSAAEQILAKKSSISVAELAAIFIRYVKTDLGLDDLIWFGNALLKMDAENITFHLLPANASGSVGNQSYVNIYVDEWLDLLNSTFNPFTEDITPGDVSILTRDSNRNLYVTDGNRRGDPSWGS